ncbi:MAG: hypothetical protein VYA30_04500 [Myxococcota bacterium]|nr:hypothetical protein [Myxococcota bacterium]
MNDNQYKTVRKMQTRPCGCSRTHRLLVQCSIGACLLILALTVTPAFGQGRVATVKEKLDPLPNFRRIELRVSPEFSAKCRQAGRKVTCAVSKLPDRFPELMVGLRGGNMAGIELVEKRKKTQIVFKLKQPSYGFQDRVLSYPTRWVLEFGAPLVLMGAVEEQFPFRPYPVPSTNISAKLPPANLHELAPGPNENRLLNACYKLWRQRRMLEAIDICNEAIESKADSAAGVMAKKILAEIWMGFVDPKVTDKLPKIIKALEDAQDASKQPEDGARYSLLVAQTLEAVGYLNRAEMKLANAVAKYEKTRAASYLLAARARMLMRLKESGKARAVLQKLREIRSGQPTVGAALLALGELAYNEGNYVTAIGLFDNVSAKWPELFNANSTAVFQAAELYRLFDRGDEAKTAYERFLKLPIKTIPDWMANIRLLELKTADAPEMAAAGFRKLALSLSKTEGQDLAFIRFARLTDKASERRRILQSLAAASTTPYVFEELTTLSIQQALEDGSLDDAYRFASTLWREVPDAYVLKAAPLLFERVLTLQLLKQVAAKKNFEVLKLYYLKKQRFESHRKRGAIHLLVAKALRSLFMLEEARLVLQKGLGGRVIEKEPAVTAQLYLNMAAVLREQKDQFRLGEILAYMDDRYPKRFDSYDYWLSKVYHAWWSKDLKRARKMLVYALNGPISDRQKLSLMDLLADLYLEMKDPVAATKTLEALIKEHDRQGGARADTRRRRARWRLCEVWMGQSDQGTTLAHLLRFLEEYPEDGHRFEARYFVGKAFIELDMPQKAKRQWDIVSREDSAGVFGKLAKLELKMLAWRQNQLNKVLKPIKL